MKRLIAAAASALLVATPGLASLAVGTKAPDFSTQVSLAGKPMPFNLKAALKKGPVVLYFYPAAFTKGCTIEAHDFAEATDDFNKMGATVIGMSADDITTLNKFSVEECRNKFAVGAAAPATIKAYDVVLPVKPDKSNRTSYVIAPDGTVIFAFSALSPVGHVTGTMDAVKAWRAKHPKA
ncbi:peroxiredoxin [Sphingomonas sp. BIUV-7]|uniref:thioredoxin-dependent peroxiredoxin n=1 Tax=Sphingomonas natans TaxID=3063330 RepID=A0ABT8YBH1_9SPHN|nr:peroxiredoxin [Sphingomonas sp. BIUV-7]MDO6415682.1 peroxiredoxin [Sphingomonas sp. BIUV-7]